MPHNTTSTNEAACIYIEKVLRAPTNERMKRGRKETREKVEDKRVMRVCVYVCERKTNVGESNVRLSGAIYVYSEGSVIFVYAEARIGAECSRLIYTTDVFITLSAVRASDREERARRSQKNEPLRCCTVRVVCFIRDERSLGCMYESETEVES